MGTRTVAFVAAVLALSAVCLAQGAPAELLSGPYVVGLSTDGGTVCWQTPADAPGAVRVKADANAAWTEVKEAKPVQFHAVKLSGLAAGTVHQVEVLADGRKLGELSFRTAPKKEDAFTFYVYGDTRTHPSAHRQVVGAMLAEAERLKQFTFVVQIRYGWPANSMTPPHSNSAFPSGPISKRAPPLVWNTTGPKR